jgi:hypothetical protein
MKRFITDNLSLPYTKRDLFVPTNAKSSNSLFNEVIAKLNTNFEYLIDMGTLNVPLSTATPESRTNLFLYFNDSSPLSSAPNSFNLSALDGNNTKFTKLSHKSYSRYGILSNILCLLDSTNQEIYIYRSGEYSEANQTVKFNSDYQLITKYSNVKPNGNLSFENIKEIELSDDGFLYVLDDFLELLIIYDMNDIILNSVFTGKIQQIKKIVNGNQLKKQTNGFSPSAISLSNGYAYVYNSFNSSVIKFDKNFNIVDSFSVQYTPKIEISGMVLDSDENVYLLYADGYSTKSNNNGELLKSGYFKDALGAGEEYLNIEISNKDNKNLFIITNKSVFKKDADRFDKSIGSFDFDNRESQFKYISNFYDIEVSSNSLYILTNYGIIVLDDVDYYLHLYQTDKLSNNIIGYEIAYDDELEQEFVFNEKFQRLVYDHLLYYHLIYRRPVVDYSPKGNELYGGFVTVKKDNIDINSYLVGINEVFSSAVFNRCIEKVYEIQEKIIEVLDAKRKEIAPVTLEL